MHLKHSIYRGYSLEIVQNIRDIKKTIEMRCLKFQFMHVLVKQWRFIVLFLD